MDDFTTQLVHCVLVLLPAGWLTPAVIDNMRHPDVNRDDVARVLRMEALEEWPDVLARVGHRRLEDREVVARVFRLVVTAELCTTILLWCAVLALAGQLFGVTDGSWPLALAKLAVLSFSVIWASFLIGGQWFYYWFGEHGQITHMLAMIWGIVTLGVLSV